MEEELKKKLKSRRAIMNAVEKCFKKTEDIYLNYSIEKLNLLSSVQSTMALKMEKYHKLSDEIMELFDEEEDVEGDVEKCMDFEVFVNEKLLTLKQFIKARQREAPPEVSVEVSKTKNVIRLPKIEIKKFSGDPTLWRTFIDSFECAVHENKNLSDIEKMNYLINLLEGEAETTIKGLNLSNDNYKIALNMLTERYGDEQIIISSLMNKLLNLEGTHRFSNIKELRILLYDTIETQVRCLNSMGLQAKNYGSMLIPVIMTKLPQEIKLIITRQFGKDIWDIDLILNAFKNELEIREKLLFTDNIENSEIPQASTLMTGNKFGDKKFPCVFCHKFSHKTQYCRTVTNISARKNILRKEKRCFLCLKPGHLIKDCYAKMRCFKCQNKHHISICNGKEEHEENSENQGGSISVNLAENKNGLYSVLLQTAQAEVISGNTSAKCRILFDSGSQMSYVTPRIKALLNLTPSGRTEMSIKTFGGGRQTKTLDYVQLAVKPKYGNNIPINAFVSEISYPLHGQHVQYARKKYNHLKNIDLADDHDSKSAVDVDILIGSDQYWNFINMQDIKRGKPGEPIAISSKLGYIISGKIDKDIESSSVNMVSTHVLKVDMEVVDKNFELNETSKFWRIEGLGINTHELKDDSNNADTVVEEFENNIKFIKEKRRYEVKLPFKENHSLLGDNYNLSKNRLKNLLSQFDHDRNLLKEYDSIIQEQLKAGIIQPAPRDHEVGNTHYLPHKPIVRKDKTTTKTRMVYDASSKMTGEISLNECLNSGPSLTTKLFEILMRFRSQNIAIISDIEKAFLQIYLNDSQRDLVRFLWFENMNEIDFENFDNNKLIEYRLCRVLFGVTSSSFLLTATLIHHVSKYLEIDAEFVEKILLCLHVDDLDAGADSVSEGFQFYNKCKERLAEASFNLRKFQSNSAELESLVTERYGGKR